MRVVSLHDANQSYTQGWSAIIVFLEPTKICRTNKETWFFYISISKSFYEQMKLIITLLPFMKHLILLLMCQEKNMFEKVELIFFLKKRTR
jgi:predicted transglutaminase-like protease